jgi:hypothetical protein
MRCLAGATGLIGWRRQARVVQHHPLDSRVKGQLPTVCRPSFPSIGTTAHASNPTLLPVRMATTYVRASARRRRSGSAASRQEWRADNFAQRAGGIRRAKPRRPPNCAASRSRSAAREKDDPSRSGRAAPAPPTMRRSRRKNADEQQDARRAPLRRPLIPVPPGTPDHRAARPSDPLPAVCSDCGTTWKTSSSCPWR